MNNKLLIGIILVVLGMFTVPATADNVMYLVPQDSSVDSPNGTVTVWLMLNTSHNDLGGFGANIAFDTSVVNVTLVEEGTTPAWDQWGWMNWGDHVCISALEFGGTGSGELQLGKITLECINPGISPLNFQNLFAPEDPTSCGNIYGDVYPDFIAINGTFTCGGAQTFTKSLPEGWNLISLPLDAIDNSTGTILSTVTYNAVKQYNAATNQFEDATVMDPGTGYFVHVTATSTWEYVGTPESSTTTQLKSGLNMIGVPNCGMSVSDAMGSADYRYAARWNAATQNYEVYNPNAPVAFHGFTTMEAGDGYFVSAGLDSALTVSCP